MNKPGELRPEKGQRKIRDLMKISEGFKSYLKRVDKNFPIKYTVLGMNFIKKYNNNLHAKY